MTAPTGCAAVAGSSPERHKPPQAVDAGTTRAQEADMSMAMFDAVAAQVNKRMDGNDKFYKPPKGWDAKDPAGCWTHDYKKGAAIDYCDGFKMFVDMKSAREYADTLKYSVMSFDTAVDMWTVTPLDAFYG
jgi:hypothetical protein